MKVLRIGMVATSFLLAAACSDPGNNKPLGTGGSTSASTSTSTGTAGSTSSSSAGTGGETCNKAPASGFTEVIAPSDGTIGAYTAVTQDANGDPMVAYVWQNPMGQSGDKSTLHFLRWDRCAGAFTAPVTLDTVGDQGFSAPNRGVGIAFDAATKKLAVVYQRTDYPPGVNPQVRVYLVTSTDLGKTWSTPLAVSQDSTPGDIYQATGPSVALHGDDVWMAYRHDNWKCCDTCGGCSGEWIGHSTDGGATFAYELIQVGGATAQPQTATPSELRLDATGKPGVVYIAADQTQSYNSQVVYYKVGTSGGGVVVFDSQNIQNDAPSASLAYDGTKPRIAAHLGADTSNSYDMRFSSSPDGVTWTAPEALPRDHSDETAWYQSLAVGSAGQAAVAAYINSGTGDATCGAPRILRSTDLTTWSVCGADATSVHGIDGKWVQAYYPPGDKLSVVTTGTLAMTNGNQSGLLFWREQ